MYIDDVLVFSKDFNQNLHHLDLVFTNLRKANLELHSSKCKFATKQVKYLGHIVSKDGLRVNPENTDKILNAKSPTNQKQVKSVLGMMGYYSKFIRNYAKIAAPLHDLLKKDKKFLWTEEAENAFQELKHKLVTAPILRYPQNLSCLQTVLTFPLAMYLVKYMMEKNFLSVMVAEHFATMS